MKDALEDLQEEIEECEDCRPNGDKLCLEHYNKRRQIRNRQELRSDPQRNRIGVRGDPTPDSEYGDQV